MAPKNSSLLVLGVSISLLFSMAHSLTCKSQKLPENRTYQNCTDLPSLSATLHYTYTAVNRSLSVAFSASPPSPDGWVAWGLNPTGGGMIGTQALIAFKRDGKVAVALYNLTSYGAIDPVKKLTFATSDVSASEAGGEITIFATVAVPSGNVSQVWQVGPVTNGKPGKHEMKPANLQAKTALSVTTGSAGSAAAPAPAAAKEGSGNSSTAGSSSSTKNGAGLAAGQRFGLGFYCGLVLVLVGFMSM